MRLCIRSGKLAASLTLGMVALVGSWPAAAQDVCSGFDRKHTITKLGGPNALAVGGLQTRVELQAYFATHTAEIHSVLASQGLGGEIADALLAAIREGTGITERPMQVGERLEWMAYRKDGEVGTVNKVCLNLAGAAPAFEIAVPVATAKETATADCRIEVATDCQPGGTNFFRVRTAPGARVTLEEPAGTRTIIEGGDPTWAGPMDDPYRSDYTFTATNEAVATETATTYTFLVPRECVNLAFVGQTEERRSGPPVTCSERRTLPQPACPVPPPPMCVIDLDGSEVRRGEIVSYQVTGKWDELDLELMQDGTLLAEPALTEASGTFIVPERGTYKIIGTASGVLDRTATCDASVEVVGADWILRPFGAFLNVDEELTTGDVVFSKSCPCPAGTAYGYDDGYGLGVSVERLFSERIGLEARGLFARLGDELWIGANGVAITDSDTGYHWDLSLGLNVHLIPKHALDWYLGPFVGYSDLEGRESLAVDRSLQYDAAGSLNWGVQTGIDWPFGTIPWSLHLGARYTRSAVDVIRRYTNPDGAVSEQSGSLDIDPITLELGVAYHF